MNPLNRRQFATFSVASLLTMLAPDVVRAEQRNSVSFLRGPYNQGYWKRHFDSERYSAGFHYHHGKQHDVLMRTKLADQEAVDISFDRSVFDFVKNKKSRTGPSMELYGPYTAQMVWKLFRCIDGTHVHHEETYDIMAYTGIPWADKKKWTDRAVRYYLDKMPDVAIMREMMEEIMPMMMPDATDSDKQVLMAQMRLKMMPGFQPGKQPGSLHDALMAVYPNMKMMPDNMQAGKTPAMMADAIIAGYNEKHGNMPDIEGYPMPTEPTLPPLPAQPALPDPLQIDAPAPLPPAMKRKRKEMR